MSARKPRGALPPRDSRKTLYIARRFVPAVIFMVFLNIGWLFVDPAKVHWVAALTGAALAVYLFVIRGRADRIFIPRPPPGAGR